MCGIAGIYNFNQSPVSEIHIRRMMQIQKHRGPDDDGVFIENNIGFGYVRLSIIDLSNAGHQPMEDTSGRYVMIYNGEIYNYIEIKKELNVKGIVFRSNTDSEVLLNAYIQWGEACLHKFNGMFAFAIYDKQKKTIFAARDRFGVKPFYYYLDENTFVFASEILAILSVLPNKSEHNKQVVFDYLLFNRTDHTEETFFSSIKKLQHGHQINIEGKKVIYKKWYDLKLNIKEPFVDAEEYKQLFSDAVALRLRSDVPVGVCLSGGIDSSSIVSVLLKDYLKNDINTFSAIYGKNIAEDESEFINEYKNSLHNMFFITLTANSLFDDMFDFIRAHAEPIPSTSPYAQYKVMKLAKKHVTVLLDGQGADEQLAGYHYFFGYYYKELFRKFKCLLLLNEIFSYYKNHHSLYALKTFGYFVLPQNIKTSLKNKKNGYLKKDFVNQYSHSSKIVGNIYNSKNLKNALINHFEYKLEHLLKWEDRNSMWFSIESRTPFLDYRIVEKTLALQSKKILHNGTTKIILREAMKGILPEKIRNRQSKIGFDTPEREWFKTTMFKNFIEDMINSKEFKENPYINSTIASKLYAKHLSGKINISQEIWKWINISTWAKMYSNK